MIIENFDVDMVKSNFSKLNIKSDLTINASLLINIFVKF